MIIVAPPPISPASLSKNELYIFHHIWRLEDAIERSETNPGRSLGDNNIIKNFAWKAIHFLMSSSKNELFFILRTGLKHAPTIANVSLNVRRLLPYLKTMHRVGKLIFYVESALSADGL